MFDAKHFAVTILSSFHSPLTICQLRNPTFPAFCSLKTCSYCCCCYQKVVPNLDFKNNIDSPQPIWISERRSISKSFFFFLKSKWGRIELMRITIICSRWYWLGTLVWENRTFCLGSPRTNSALNPSPPLGLSLPPEALGLMKRYSRLRFGTLLARKGQWTIHIHFSCFLYARIG